MAKEFVKVPFDIEKAKKIYKGELEGRIVTEGNYAVKILCMDANIANCPIVALLTVNFKQKAATYTKEGKFYIDGYDCDENLMLELPSSVLYKEGDILCKGNEYLIVFKDENNKLLGMYVSLDGDNGFTFGKRFIEDESWRYELATEEEKERLRKEMFETPAPAGQQILKLLQGNNKEEKDRTSTAVITVPNSIKSVKDKFIKINGLLDNRREGKSKTDEMFLNLSAIVSVYKDGLKYYIKVSTGELYRICMADYYEVIRIIEGK